MRNHKRVFLPIFLSKIEKETKKMNEDSKKKSTFKARKISEKINSALKNGEITTSFEFFPAKTAKGNVFSTTFAVQSVPRLFTMALVGHFLFSQFIERRTA